MALSLGWGLWDPWGHPAQCMWSYLLQCLCPRKPIPAPQGPGLGSWGWGRPGALSPVVRGSWSPPVVSVVIFALLLNNSID